VQLLQLGATLREKEDADVVLIDAMHHPRDERLRRERVAVLKIDNQPSNKWRFGVSKREIENRLQALRSMGWSPDRIFVECFATFWWEGAREAIEVARLVYPHSRVTLVGTYPALATDHAKANAGADDVGFEPPVADCQSPLAYDLYPNQSGHAYITLDRGRRAAEDILDEIERRARRRAVQHFAFAEHGAAAVHLVLYRRILEGIIERGLKIGLYALGDISPSAIVAQPDLPSLMKRAGYKQTCFSDDRELVGDQSGTERRIHECRIAALLCHEAGFRARTDDLVGSVCIGKPGESLSERAKAATMTAHYLGSVILWPYQPEPRECTDIPLEAQNGKLFPFRHLNGATYRDYLGLLGLGTVLTAKYRTRTFDFLGEGFVPGLFRASLAREAWDPDPAVKGSLQLPVLARR